MRTAHTNRHGKDDVLSEIDHICDRDHFVHFYDHDQQLTEGVARYLAVGFAQGNLGLVIATREHLDAIDAKLAGMSVDPQALRANGHYSTFDAAEMLERFMVNGRPDPRRFRAIIGNWMKAAAQNGTGVRAFGEMVALLWAERNHEGAIELEQIWNELGQIHDFSLYCAYPAPLTEDAEGDSYLRICREHSRIIRAHSPGYAGVLV